MAEVGLYNMQGESKGTLALSDEIFGAPINMSVMHQALLMQLANRRRGTASTKTRAEVAGGGRKPWRQKGTGRARHGSNRSPLWKGGGVTFGPRPRDFSKKMPKKMRRLALKGALTTKVNENKMIAIDDLIIDVPKTKDFIGMMKNLKLEESVLFIIKEKDHSVEKSASNIPHVTVITPDSINIHDILNHDRLVMTTEAIRRIEEVLI